MGLKFFLPSVSGSEVRESSLLVHGSEISTFLCFLEKSMEPSDLFLVGKGSNWFAVEAVTGEMEVVVEVVVDIRIYTSW
ncbi:hypothetical protein Bca4012_036903 [Brassica carinata]